jgi:hypothetical protein
VPRLAGFTWEPTRRWLDAGEANLDSRQPAVTRRAFVRVQKIADFGDTASVTEYLAGAAQRQITYPGLQQCISITGYHVGRVLGTHVSPGATSDELDEHFRLLSSECGDHWDIWYVAGQLQNHFSTSTAIINSLGKLRQTLHTKLGKDATYYLFDTSNLSNDLAGWGVDVRATLVGTKVEFAVAKWPSRNANFMPLNVWHFKRL